MPFAVAVVLIAGCKNCDAHYVMLFCVYIVRDTDLKMNNTGKWWELRETNHLIDRAYKRSQVFLTPGVLTLLHLNFVSQC